MLNGNVIRMVDVNWHIWLEDFCPCFLTYLVTWNWGNRNVYLCRCWNLCFSAAGGVPFRPHHCCLSRESRDPQVRRSSSLIYWFLFLRFHDLVQCYMVNYCWCKSLEGCAGLEPHVVDILGVIGLINWRIASFRDDLLVDCLEKRTSASSFSHFKSRQCWISAVYFSD